MLRQPDARIVGDLPTYSFRRKRCWIYERIDGHDQQSPADQDVDRDRDHDRDYDHDHELVRAFLLSELTNVLPGGKDLDPAETFIELGGDSFAAMQLTVSIEEHCGVEIPLDEFDGDLQISSLIDRLSRRIVRANDWTASRATRQDDDLCPPSYLDASYLPPSTPTSYVQPWTGQRGPDPLGRADRHRLRSRRLRHRPLHGPRLGAASGALRPPQDRAVAAT